MWRQHRFFKPILNTFLIAGGMAVIGGGAWFVSEHPMFVFNNVILEDAPTGPVKHVTAESIARDAMPRIAGNFFTADLDQVRDVIKAVPWVREAHVRREWPNRLYVQVEEHRPMGTWADGQLLSVKGELFTANIAEAEEDVGPLPDFTGPEGTQKDVIANFQSLQGILKPLGVTPRAVSLSPRYAWSVKLNNGTFIELGRENKKGDVEKRLKRFVTVYPQIAMKYQDKIDSVDLRYPAGLTIKGPSVVIKQDAPKK